MTFFGHRDFNAGNPYPSAVMDAVFNFIATYISPNLVLDHDSTTVTLRAGASTDGFGADQPVAIAIGGSMRWRTSLTTVAVSGAAGLRYIWVTAPALDTAQEDAGTFDYTFTMAVRTLAQGSPGGGVNRCIGEVSWSGTALTGPIKLYHAPKGIATNPADGSARVTGVFEAQGGLIASAGSTSVSLGDPGTGRPSVTLGNTGDTIIYRDVLANVATDSSVSIGGALSVDDGIGLNGTGSGNGITFDGDSYLYRTGPGSIKTDGEMHVATLLSSGAAVHEFLYANVPGDAAYRIFMDHNGGITWGDGSGPGDTNLYRSAPGVLTTNSRVAFPGGRTMHGVIAGYVSDAGAVLNGSGFTVTKTGTGTYIVSFTIPFPTVPICVANTNTGSISAGTFSPATGSVSIETRTGGGLTDSYFFFIATPSV